MKLNLTQFEVLESIEYSKDHKITQREIASKKNISVGTVNKTINELLAAKVIDFDNDKTYTINDLGYQMLEPYRVKKAIFIAAGFGSRLVPITLNTPKPLIHVHGKRIIDSLLDAVIAAGIDDITIVRGYLSEQFDILKNKYPMIKFVENPLYNESNNISSIAKVCDQLDNAYVFESDLLLSNPRLIRKYEFTSNYLGIYKQITDDWCFEMKGTKIDGLAIGGVNCMQMVGISYWDSKSANKMKTDVLEVFSLPGGKEKYWDQVALDVKKDNYEIVVRSCNEDDIIEIDTINELKEIDRVYAC